MTERDPNGIQPHEPGAKLDSGKPMVWLCISGFSRALNEVAKVTTEGAKKYTPNGWKGVKDGPTRYMDAFGRHALALGSGEIVDPDTGCLHKAQMIWNLLASLELELAVNPGLYARFSKEIEAGLLAVRPYTATDVLNDRAAFLNRRS